MRLLKISVIILLFVGLVSCKDDSPKIDCQNNPESEECQEKEEHTMNPIIIITLTDGRTINIELYPEVAPKSVANFLKLVEAKHYDGVIFHRVIENFMIQTGQYYIDGNFIKDKPETDPIKGEFTENGFKNDLLHELGVISMARTNDPNSATSQFFICSASSPHLDGKYAAFGKTIDESSNEVVLDISKTAIGYLGPGFEHFPVNPVTIASIRIKQD